MREFFNTYGVILITLTFLLVLFALLWQSEQSAQEAYLRCLDKKDVATALCENLIKP